MGPSTNSVLDAPSAEETLASYRDSTEITTNPPTVRIVRTLSDVEDLREIWNLWCDDPNADMDFYLASAQCREDFVRPHVIVIYREGRPDCMLIGRLEHCRVKVKVGYVSIAEPKVVRLFFLQGGLLGNASEENSRLLMREIKLCLRRGEADSSELARVLPDSNLDRAAREEFNDLVRGHYSPLQEHRWIELPQSFEEFLKGLSRKNRHEIRRHEKMLANDFAERTQIRCYRHEHEIGSLFRDAETIAAKTYQRGLGVGFQQDDEVLESLRIAARNRGMRGCVLYLDQRPCAFFIGKQYRNTFYGHFMGFDPQFGKYSPGLVLLMHSIEECFDPDYRAGRVDLGWGDRRYKRMICNQSQQDGPLYLYAASWRGLRLNFLRSVTSFLDFAGRRLLEKSPFLQKLKAAWQRRQQKSNAENAASESAE